MKLTTSKHRAPRLEIIGATPLLPLYSFMESGYGKRCLLSCHQTKEDIQLQKRWQNIADKSAPAIKHRTIRSIGGQRCTSPCVPTLSTTFRGSNSFLRRFTVGGREPQRWSGLCGRVTSLFFCVESTCPQIIQPLTEVVV
jgi:hypothetical protein